MSWQLDHDDTRAMEWILGDVVIQISYDKAPIERDRPGKWAIIVRPLMTRPHDPGFGRFCDQRFRTATEAGKEFRAIKRHWPAWLETHPDLEAWVLTQLV